MAVAVDDAGLVLGRADVADTDVALAACAAAEQVSAASANAVAVASINPESPASIASMRTLGEHFRGTLVPGGAIPSGTAAAVAEAWVGAARGAKEVVYFGVADHVSAGILRDGLPVTGAHRRAASVAWLALNPVEREDYRKTGCLEAEVAASGIVRRLVWRIKAGDRSRVQDAAGGDLAAVTLDLVLSAARIGDGVAISVMRDTAKLPWHGGGQHGDHRRPRIARDRRDHGLGCRPAARPGERRDRATPSGADDAGPHHRAGDAWPRRARHRRGAPGRRRAAMIVLSGAELVLPDRILTPGTLVVDGGRIGDIRPGAAHPAPGFAFQGHYIVPGFIDVHLHGAGGVDCLDPGAPVAAIAASLPRPGVAAFCPTTVACGPDALRRVLSQVRQARAAPGAAVGARVARPP